MSPEQLRSEELDARSDLYSLGRVLYEAATGSMGIEGRAVGEVFEAILTRTPPLASTPRPDTPPALDVVIDRLLQRDPGNRFDSASEIREAMIVVGRDRSAAGSFERSVEGIRTLGRSKSGATLIATLLAALPLSIDVASLAEPGENWLDSSPWLILALVGFTLAWLIHRRSSPRAKPSATSRPLKLRRLEEQNSDRGWMWAYVLPGIGALLMTIVTVYSVWNMTRDKGSSALELAFRAAFAVLFWIHVARARRWHEDPPSRRSREIEQTARSADSGHLIQDRLRSPKLSGLSAFSDEVVDALVLAGWPSRTASQLDQTPPDAQTVRDAP